jgi:hypothetical protein
MEFLPYLLLLPSHKFFVFNERQMAKGVQMRRADEVARIGALSNWI